MSRVTSIAGLVLAFAGFDATNRLVDILDLPNEELWPHIWKWIPTLSLLGFVHFIENEALSSVGVRSCSLRRFTVETVISLVVLLGANVVTDPILKRISGEGIEEGIGSFASFSIPERLFIAVTAGATEEIMFRGYAMERLKELTGSSILAGTISGSVFTLTHLNEIWDRSAVLRITQPTAILTVLYSRVRNLPVCIAVHTLNDAVGLLLAGRYVDNKD